LYLNSETGSRITALEYNKTMEIAPL
jgi:hypothetical protein